MMMINFSNMVENPLR